MIETKGQIMFRIFIAISAFALFVAACGSSPSSSDAATPADTPAVAAADHADDEATHDEEATHDDDHEAGEAHEEDATHDDDHEAGEAHEEGAAVVADAAEADRTIEVSMTELSFNPDSVTVSAGETIHFVVTNVGQITHEFRLSNEDRIEEHIASGHADHDDGGDEAAMGGHHGDTDIVLQLEAGETGEVTVTFPEDTSLFDEIACLIPGHYEAGMKAPLEYA